MSRETWIVVMAAALGIDAAACHMSQPPGSEVSSREVVSVAPPSIDSAPSAVPSAAQVADAAKPRAEIDAGIGLGVGLGTLKTAPVRSTSQR